MVSKIKKRPFTVIPVGTYQRHFVFSLCSPEVARVSNIVKIKYTFKFLPTLPRKGTTGYKTPASFDKVPK